MRLQSYRACLADPGTGQPWLSCVGVRTLTFLVSLVLMILGAMTLRRGSEVSPVIAYCWAYKPDTLAGGYLYKAIQRDYKQGHKAGCKQP